ncbi:tetratricopeptide repeat protein [Cognatishimia sp. MH4019]|uniref:tetratricopeptide repeat protein n=1 Tax=Cognatishimia sp. MH4019 TaxID=2854030 RepID=UPI001CD22DD1|nr:tetratricopeptide repeat protein [Cognatishimia sp. MH4019]
MMICPRNRHRIVTAFFVTVSFCLPFSGAFAADEQALLDDLATASPEEAAQIEDQLARAWAKSGSAAMDLLLQRGRDALEAGDLDAAIEHFTALTDHAPEFAEGWNMRATVFFQQDKPGLALEDLTKALTLNPNHFGAIIGLAVILEQTGYPADALEAYRTVQSIHPHQDQVATAIERLEKEVGGQDI